MRHPIRLATLAIVTSSLAVTATLAERPPVVRSATHTLRQAIGDELWTAPGEARIAGELPCADTPVGPPPDPGLGDSWDWYIWALAGPPVATLSGVHVAATPVTVVR